jgi:hypothetical protein
VEPAGGGEGDGGLQAAGGARRPFPPDRAPPRRPVPGVRQVAELPLIVFIPRSTPANTTKDAHVTRVVISRPVTQLDFRFATVYTYLFPAALLRGRWRRSRGG